MSFLEIASIVVQLLTPLMLIAWIAVDRGPEGGSSLLDLSIVAVYILAIALAMPWLVLPWYLPAVYTVLLLCATGIRIFRGDRRARRLASRRGIAVRVVAVLFVAAVVGISLAGRQRLPGTPVDLEFPLRGGTYLVANGGSRELINPHLTTRSRERSRPWRGQSYAVDIVRVGRWGSRRSRLSPADPSGFAIFGDSLFAPCAGTVIRTSDGQPDELPVGAEPETFEGNHVLLECGSAWVLIAHMRRGSVQVMEGSAVAVGHFLGQVGNSGRSGEPHVHVHAQTPGTPEAPLSGDPLPVTFGGRHLVRNDRVRM